MSVEATRPYHHGNLRSELLARAEDVLAERGAAALSLRELARDVGVSHGAPRRHFQDKQALLDALAEDGFDRLAAELEAAVEGAGAEFASRFAAVAHAYVGFATRHAALLELMFAVKHRSDAATRLTEAAARSFAAPVSVIVDGQRSGAVAAGDPAHLARAAFATFHGVATMANGGLVAEGELDAVLDGAVALIARGMRPG